MNHNWHVMMKSSLFVIKRVNANPYFSSNFSIDVLIWYFDKRFSRQIILQYSENVYIAFKFAMCVMQSHIFYKWS